MGDGGLVGLRDPDIAVDAAAGIPAGGFLGIVDADDDLVLAGLQGRVQADGEGGVAVRPAAQADAVDFHGRMRHRAVDFQVDVFGRQFFFADFQRFPIGGLSPPGEFAAFARIFLLEGSFHAPVVGKVQDTARAVLLKGPSFVERRPARRLGRRGEGYPRQSDAEGDSSHIMRI